MLLYDEKQNRWLEHRQTQEYHLRKQWLKSMWIIVGLILILIPLGAQIIVGLFATFISFSLLDEKPYQQPRLHNPEGTNPATPPQQH